MSEIEAEQYKTRGNEFLKSKEYDKAIEQYTKAIELNPTNYMFYSNRSAAYASSGKYIESLDDAEKTIELNPTWAKGYSRKGASLEYLNRIEEAVEAYKTGLKYDPNNQQLQLALKNIRESSKEPNYQETLFKLLSDPNFAKIYNDPSFQQKLKEAQNDPSKLFSDPNFMNTFANACGGCDSSKCNDKHTHHDPYSTSSEKSESKSSPECKNVKEVSISEKEKEIGNEYYKKREFDKAIEHYQKAKELDPNTIIYDLNISAALFEDKKYDECIKLCEEIVERGRSMGESYKNISKAYSRMGNVYTKLEDYESAKKYYNKSLAEYRDENISKKLKETEKILNEIEKTKYINPELSEEEKKIGNKCFSEGKYPESIKHYTEAIKRNPNDAVIYSNRAAAYTKLMEYHLCIADCNKSITLDPKFIKSYLRKANALLYLKDPQQARSSYEKVLEMDSTNKEALDGVSKCYELINKMTPEEVTKNAMRDPEVQDILNDPNMRIILENMQNDPSSVSRYMKDPTIYRKIEKLIDAGVIKIGKK